MSESKALKHAVQTACLEHPDRYVTAMKTSSSAAQLLAKQLAELGLHANITQIDHVWYVIARMR